MLAFLYTSDYRDGGDPHPVTAAVVAFEDALGDVHDDEEEEGEEQPVSAWQHAEEEQDVDSATAESDVNPAPSLLNNVLVYALADKYDIAELRELARGKFQTGAGRLLSATEFPEIVREVYSSTPSSDRGLRDIVSQICARRGREMVENPDVNPVIVEVGDFALDLLREVLKCEDVRVEEAEPRNRSLRGKMKSKMNEIVELERRVGAVSRVLTNLAGDVKTGNISEGRFFYRGVDRVSTHRAVFMHTWVI